MFSEVVLEFSHVEVHEKSKINTEKYMATLMKPGSRIDCFFSEHQKDNFAH